MNSLKYIVVGIALGYFSMLQVAGQESDVPVGRNLRAKLAEVGLKLAQLELQQAEQFNREIAKNIEDRTTLDNAVKSRMLASKQLSKATMETLRSNVLVSAAALERAMSTEANEAEDLLLQHAADNVRLCEARWEQAKVIASTMNGQAIANVERARLKHQEATLRYQLLQEAGGIDDAVGILYVRTNLLSEEHIALEQRVASLEQIFSRERWPRDL